MIQQIQSEEEDDNISDSEDADASGADVDDGTDNTEDPTSVDQPRAVADFAAEWRVISIKPGGVKAADHNQ